MSGSLYRLLVDNFPADRGRIALKEPGGRRFSFGDLEARSARYARGLAGLGVSKGDRVAVQAPKSPEALFLYLACLRAGAVFLPMNPAYTDHEAAYLLGDAAPGLFVCDPAREAGLGPVAKAAGVAHLLTLGEDGAGSLADAVAAEAAEFETVPCADGDLAALLYTSGTTGKPKGAMLSHRNLADNGLVLRDTWGITGDDVLIHALPIFHTHGLFVACHTFLLAGGRMLWLPRFDLESVLEALAQASVMMGVPTFYTRLLADARFDRARCAGMRLFTSGSAPLLAERPTRPSRRAAATPSWNATA